MCIQAILDAYDQLFSRLGQITEEPTLAEKLTNVDTDTQTQIGNALQAAKDLIAANVVQLNNAIASALAQALASVGDLDTIIGEYKSEMAGYFQPLTADGQPAGIKITHPTSKWAIVLNNDRIQYLYDGDETGYDTGVESVKRVFQALDKVVIGNADEGYFDLDMTPIGLIVKWRRY
jgi:hypothetical protein